MIPGRIRTYCAAMPDATENVEVLGTGVHASVDFKLAVYNINKNIDAALTDKQLIQPGTHYRTYFGDRATHIVRRITAFLLGVF